MPSELHVAPEETTGPVAAMMQTSSVPAGHQPVMPAEVLRYLHPHPGAVIVDGTVGMGGHSAVILPRLLPDGRLIAIDRDRESLDLARKRLAEFEPQVEFIHGNYRYLSSLLQQLGLSGIDGILLDLGMSSVQVDRSERGFSFLRDGPLDMRMDRTQERTAEMLVNELSADELEDVFKTFGEERFAKSIARRVVQERRAHPITTTTQLAHLVMGVVPARTRHGRLHPATRVFQALRIAVNDELGALQELLGCLRAVLRPDGRVVMLTFHSLEDRMVKRAFVHGMSEQWWTMLTKKPIGPSEEEIARNPRARSAKLRAIESR